MEIISGLIIMLGLLIIGISGYEAFSGIDGAWATALVGVVVTAIGIYLSGRNWARPIQQGSETHPGGAGRQPHASPEERRETIYSVIQTGDDSVIDRVESLLEKDPRVTAIVSETGRWHQTPDRDDLPEWTALRVYFGFDGSEEARDHLTNLIRENLGPDALNRVTIRPY